MKIQLQQLSKSFGEKVAVDIPQLEIGDGEIIGLVGNNGAGKTTLFRLMLDLLRADSGPLRLLCLLRLLNLLHFLMCPA